VKLLLDQNISYRVAKSLADLYPDMVQVKRLGLENFTDIQIWKYAKKNNYTIITFDADFYDIANLNGYPPNIIWLKTGNRKTASLISLLREKYDAINYFLNDESSSNIACLEIH